MIFKSPFQAKPVIYPLPPWFLASFVSSVCIDKFSHVPCSELSAVVGRESICLALHCFCCTGFNVCPVFFSSLVYPLHSVQVLLKSSVLLLLWHTLERAVGSRWVEKAALPSGPVQHRSCSCFCCRGQLDTSAAVVLWLPQEFCYCVLCVYLGAGTNTGKPPWCSHLRIISCSRSVSGDFGNLCWLSVSMQVFRERISKMPSRLSCTGSDISPQVGK